jgi:pyruvate dehydrogenase E2 component (dihydrolipoamide acetyltransferase)
VTPDPIRRTPTRMRRAIVKSMNASALVPQFTIESDASVDALAGLRREQASTGVTVSYSDLFVAATARALKLHPGLNSSYGDDAILEHQVVNIGLAVALEDGLIAPAIRDADQLTLAQIVEARERLTAAAQAGTLTPEDVFSTTFTVSNLGPYGVRRFRALVVPPQAAILALGAITPDGQVSLSLSCDHRVLDGAHGAEFLRDLVGLLERLDWLDPGAGQLSET